MEESTPTFPRVTTPNSLFQLFQKKREVSQNIKQCVEGCFNQPWPKRKEKSLSLLSESLPNRASVSRKLLTPLVLLMDCTGFLTLS